MAANLAIAATVTSTPTAPKTGVSNATHSVTRTPALVDGPHDLRFTTVDPATTPIPLGAIVSGRALLLRVLGGGRVLLRITTADGSAQIVPVEGALLLENPSDGAFTALSVTRPSGPAGTSDVEYVIAGDAS